MDAMKTALALEKTVNESLYQLHEVAVNSKDDEVSWLAGVTNNWLLL